MSESNSFAFLHGWIGVAVILAVSAALSWRATQDGPFSKYRRDWVQTTVVYFGLGVFVAFVFIWMPAWSGGKESTDRYIPPSDWERCMETFDSQYDCREWGVTPDGDY